MEEKKKALEIQVGGSHYKRMGIQPFEYAHANRLGACEFTVVKYVTRWREKGGLEDLKKAKHCIDILIELETREREAAISIAPPTCSDVDEDDGLERLLTPEDFKQVFQESGAIQGWHQTLPKMGKEQK